MCAYCFSIFSPESSKIVTEGGDESILLVSQQLAPWKLLQHLATLH
jgi:hypothetical protein